MAASATREISPTCRIGGRGELRCTWCGALRACAAQRGGKRTASSSSYGNKNPWLTKKPWRALYAGVPCKLLPAGRCVANFSLCRRPRPTRPQTSCTVTLALTLTQAFGVLEVGRGSRAAPPFDLVGVFLKKPGAAETQSRPIRPAPMQQVTSR